MRRIFALLAVVALTGCPSLNSVTKDQHGTDMPKACSCPGNMSCCQHTADGRLCCTPDECSCRQVTAR